MAPGPPLSVQPWIYLICMVLGPGDSRVTFNHSTETDTDFYQDEPLVLTCMTDHRPNLSGDPSNYGISFGISVDVPEITGCTIHSIGSYKVSSIPADVTFLNKTSDEGCEAVRADSQWNMLQTVRIDSALTKYTISCCYVNLNNGTDLCSQRTLKLESIKVAPSELHMNIAPDTLREGEGFSVECISTGANPQSEYNYIITKLRTGEEVTTDNTHVTTIADRGGLKVRCVDNQHPNYANKVVTEAERVIIPAYIDYIGQAREENLIYTGYSENILNCAEKIKGEPELEYEWKMNGSRIESNESSYDVGYDGSQTKEYECTAKVVDFNLSATYKWQISYRADPDADADAGAGPSVQIIVGVLVGVAVCAGISIGGYLWWKNKIHKKVRVDPFRKEAGIVREKDVKEGVELAREKRGAGLTTTIKSSGTTQQQLGPARKEAGVVGGKQEKAKVEPVKGKTISANKTTLESSGSTHQQIPLQKKKRSRQQTSPVKR